MPTVNRNSLTSACETLLVEHIDSVNRFFKQEYPFSDSKSFKSIVEKRTDL